MRRYCQKVVNRAVLVPPEGYGDSSGDQHEAHEKSEDGNTARFAHDGIGEQHEQRHDAQADEGHAYAECIPGSLGGVAIFQFPIEAHDFGDGLFFGDFPMFVRHCIFLYLYCVVFLAYWTEMRSRIPSKHFSAIPRTCMISSTLRKGWRVRWAMMARAYASPIPGNVSSCAWVAVLMFIREDVGEPAIEPGWDAMPPRR